MKIVIADDHELFSEGLKNLLEARGYEIIGLAKNGMEAFDLAKKLRPDVMLIDIFMPECDGLEATMLINSNFPDIKIVILTSSENEQNIFNAVKSGACGYFIKNFNSDNLFELLESLKKGENPVSPGIAGNIIQEVKNGKKTNKSDFLTKRQLEVLSLISKGYIYKEVADKLSITERTVKYHVKKSIDKLHLYNREQLISYIAKTGLIE